MGNISFPFVNMDYLVFLVCNFTSLSRDRILILLDEGFLRKHEIIYSRFESGITFPFTLQRLFNLSSIVFFSMDGLLNVIIDIGVNIFF